MARRRWRLTNMAPPGLFPPLSVVSYVVVISSMCCRVVQSVSGVPLLEAAKQRGRKLRRFGCTEAELFVFLFWGIKRETYLLNASLEGEKRATGINVQKTVSINSKRRRPEAVVSRTMKSYPTKAFVDGCMRKDMYAPKLKAVEFVFLFFLFRPP
jgi:hypothetical protein